LLGRIGVQKKEKDKEYNGFDLVLLLMLNWLIFHYLLGDTQQVDQVQQ
jgi:uncharacterized membrane protein YhdT